MTFKRVGKDDEREEGQEDSSDFEKMLSESLGKQEKRLSVGEKIKAEVLSVGKENIIVATGTRYDGFVAAPLLLNEQGQSKVKTGDLIDLFVTHIKGGEIHLSPLAAQSSVSGDLEEAYSQNLLVQGKVEAVNKGGFEVSLNGKSAFCPLSQMDTKRIEKPEDYVGRKFEFKITQLDPRNVVVSRRKALEETQSFAHSQFKDQRKVGDSFSGKVTRVEPFGAFIEIAPGLEGLAHVSELSWTRVANPSDFVKVGDSVQGKILRMEHEGGRLKISLTLKDDSNDPWKNMPSQIQVGRVVGGKVTRCMDFGAFVELVPGMEGLVPMSALSAKRVSRADEVVKPGDMVSVMVKDINPSMKRISLSIKDAQEEAASMTESQDIRDYAAKQAARESASSGKGSLADKLQAALNKKK